MIRRRIAHLLLIAVILAVAACATKTQKVEVYKQAAYNLVNIHDQIEAMCKSGNLKPDKCHDAKLIYNEAATLHFQAGEALKAYLSSSDQPTAEQKLQLYQAYTTQVTFILTQLAVYGVDLGVIK